MAYATVRKQKELSVFPLKDPLN